MSRLSDGSALHVPFFDLAPSHELLKGDILEAVADLLGSGAFTNGPQVAAFEEAFGAYCGTAHCIGTASGLDALRLTLQALGLEPGGEVLVPAMTFIATFEAVTQAGGVPVPVDVSPADYCIDVAGIDAAVGPRTRIVMPVDLYGRVADTGTIRTVAAARDLLVVEDACQAHGASRNGARAGKGGIGAAFSFYPAKNLGAIGDAGALVTDDAELAGRVRALREHGQKRKYEHELIGWTSRLDTIQATVLLRKLPHLDEWNEQRRSIADLYARGLEGVGDLVLPDTSDRGQVWHLFVVLTEDPTGLAAHLAARSIGTGRHYPEPPHLSEAYAHLGLAAGSFPVAEDIARRGLSLPIFPGMSESQAEYVVESIRSWFASG